MRNRRWHLLAATVVLVIAAGFAHRFLVVKLELTPNQITTCPNVPAQINVTWRAPRTDVVKIFIYQLGEAPRLWTMGGSKGEARTGPWIGDGTTLMITDGSGKPLARKTVESIVCPA